MTERVASGPAPSRPREQIEQPIWVPFVRASIILATTVGFTLGLVVGLARALGRDGAVELAATRVHGHVQIAGWGGLMVLGIALHFVPRLLGVPLARPERARRALSLLVAGLLTRLITQPAQALFEQAGTLHDFLSLWVALGGVLEIAGASLVLVMLGQLMLHERPNAKRAATGPLQLLLGTAFVSLWLMFMVDTVGLVMLALSDDPSGPERMSRLASTLGIHGFLVSVSLAMSSRLFPLYLRTPAVRPRWLALAAALLIVGLVLRLGTDAVNSARWGGAARLLQAAALFVAVVALGVFRRRRPLPRRETHTLREPLQLYGLSAYGWLLGAMLLLVLAGLHAIGLNVPAVGVDAERHALGVGFVTLLILGLGSEMIPGYARRGLRSERLRWLVLVAGNLAAGLRVAASLMPDRTGASTATLMTLAGLAALLALVLFAANIGFPGFAPDRQGQHRAPHD